MEAIILAGGLGTRLRSKVSEKPKSMAPIKGVPFLEYQLNQMIENGVNRFIFSVGYKYEIIQNHFNNQYKNCEIIYAIEESQLGTGGAILNALQYVKGERVLIANGDSLFKVNIQEQIDFHIKNNADVTLALKPMQEFERYGTVDLAKDRIIQFKEKQFVDKGLINGGLYIFNTDLLKSFTFPEKFSIEKDFFEAKVQELSFYGYISNGYFLDIGIPEDFLKSQYEMGIFPKISSDWTLYMIHQDLDDSIIKKLKKYFGVIEFFNDINNIHINNQSIIIQDYNQYTHNTHPNTIYLNTNNKIEEESYSINTIEDFLKILDSIFSY